MGEDKRRKIPTRTFFIIKPRNANIGFAYRLLRCGRRGLRPVISFGFEPLYICINPQYSKRWIQDNKSIVLSFV